MKTQYPVMLHQYQRELKRTPSALECVRLYCKEKPVYMIEYTYGDGSPSDGVTLSCYQHLVERLGYGDDIQEWVISRLDGESK